jgi:OmpA-OmpF porin, OOP family
MIKRMIIGAFVLMYTISAHPQQWKLKRVEAIFGIGTTSVYSDLGGSPNAKSFLFIRDFTFRSTRPSIYLGARYRLKPNVSFKFSLLYGYSRTEDYEGSRNEKRGFTSVTQLLELSGGYEYYIVPELRRLRSAAMFNRRGMINDYSSFGAYVFAGLGATLFWPDISYDQPRENDRYKHNMGVTASLPLGVGIKYIISDKWIFGYEIGYRLTISDYLDGFISPYSKRPDTYWATTFNFSFRIPTSNRGWPIFLDKYWRRAKF